MSLRRNQILAPLLAFAVGILNAAAGTLAQFRTPLGDIEVELFDRDKPVTTANFIRYVQVGFYRDGFIHRWEPHFVIQGGGFFLKNRFATNAFIAPVPNFAPITNEFPVGPKLSNGYGTIAMARAAGLTNSATSQWFLNLTNNADLDNVDGGFTVFGKVISGTNLLNRFNITNPTNGIFRTDLSDPLHPNSILDALNHLPVVPLASGSFDLIFVDVTLLQVSVSALVGGGREISWNSARDLTNRVEYTTNFPPVWISLAITNGTGERIRVSDLDSASAQRFYRVRVDY
ncbi:MAG: peptidylprolyl isomerase [Verrucomicrobia bacterium]|nr:peptidylprolyl isomerase [Verrucomicrobiota bacterium]